MFLKNPGRQKTCLNCTQVLGPIRVGTMTLPICKGVTKAGTRCSYRGRHHGYCKVHADPEHLCDTGKDLGDCPICYEKVTKGTSTITSCKHIFHRRCLQRWTDENSTCPMCRANIRPTTGVLRPRPSPRPVPGLNMTTVIYVNSHEELMPYLNAPVEIRFTANYWDTV